MVQIANRQITARLVLPERNRMSWQQHATRLKPPHSEPDESFLCESAGIALMHLPASIQQQQATLLEPCGPVVISIENLPIDVAIPEPPKDSRRPQEKRTWVSEASLLGTTRANGLEVFSYRQEHQGRWPQQVAPVPGSENGNHSGNTADFGFHTDNAILEHPYIADFIALIGLRNDAATPTNIVAVDDLLEELHKVNPTIISVLMDPTQWRVPYPESFSQEFCGALSKPCPVLTRNNAGEYEMALAIYNVVAQSEEAEYTITTLKKLLRPPLIRSFVLCPGMLLMMNNRRALHARGRIDGPRWAQRIYLTRDLHALMPAIDTNRSSRIVDVNKVQCK